MERLSASASQVRTILIVTISYVVVAGVFALSKGNSEFLFYIAVMVVLGIAIYAVHRKVGISAGLLWCLSAWGLMHMAGGLVGVPESWPTLGEPVLYNLWLIPDMLKYDQLTHAFGFGTTTWLCWQGLSSAIPEVKPTTGMMVLCVAGGMGFGALNEVIEFFATLTMANTNVGGYENTGWDLVANLVGCSVAAVLISVTWRREH